MTIIRTATEDVALDINPVFNISIFLAFVAVTLFIVIRASRNNKTAADYYAAGRSFTGPQNGFAIAGDYLSAASFLGIAGAIALLPDKDEDGDPLNTEALALLKHCQQQVWNVSLYQLFAREVEKASGGVKLSVDW